MLLTDHLVSCQEYQPLVKKEAAYAAVDKNTSGSRPRELFEDAVEEAEAALELDRKALDAAVKAKDMVVAPDSTFEVFEAALVGADGLDKLQPTSMCALMRPNRRSPLFVVAFVMFSNLDW